MPHEGGGAIPNQLVREGMAVTIVDTSRPVTGGVDTHLDVHMAAALDGIGGLLGVEQFKTTAAGNQALLGWLKTLGTPVRVGVEGTGPYGAGLLVICAGRESTWWRWTAPTARNAGTRARPTRWTP